MVRTVQSGRREKAPQCLPGANRNFEQVLARLEARLLDLYLEHMGWYLYALFGVGAVDEKYPFCIWHGEDKAPSDGQEFYIQ